MSACNDPSACTRAGAERCEANGRGVVRCVQTERGLRWQTEPCDPSVPTCVETRSGAATCIAEGLGACDEASFEDSCPNERTIEDCTAGVRHRVRCADGQRCGEVPGYAIGEGRAAHASHACYTPRDPDAPAPLVTFASGDVSLGDATAPPVPFTVPAGRTLRLAEGARVVVLVKERPSRLEGPTVLRPSELQPEAIVAEPWARALVEILASAAPRQVPPEEPLQAPGPSEDGLVRLTVGEGVPGASNTLGTIAWRCSGECGRTVELRIEGTQPRVLWRGTGSGSVRYDGPDLELGETYQLRLGERRYRVETVAAPNLRPLLVQMASWPLADQMSVVAAVHRWNGSRAAALNTLRSARLEPRGRDPDLARLLAAYGAE